MMLFMLRLPTVRHEFLLIRSSLHENYSRTASLMPSWTCKNKLPKKYALEPFEYRSNSVVGQTICVGEELSYDLYNEMLCKLCEEGKVDDAMDLLSEIEALGFRPNSVSYSWLITGLGNLGRTLEAEAIFQEMLIAGCRPKIKLFNSILASFLRKSLLELSHKLLKAMDHLRLERNRKTFEILIDYHVKAGQLKDMWCVLAEMRRKGYHPDSSVYSKVLDMYRDRGMWKKAMAVLGEVRASGLLLDSRMYNSIIDTFGKYGELGDARIVFEKMQEEGIKPDINTWNSLIHWHCKFGDIAGAMNLLHRMQEEGIYPDLKIFMTLISHLGEEGKWDIITKLLDNMKLLGKSGFIYTILVDIYWHNGRFKNPEECIMALKSIGVQLSPNLFCVLANAYAQQCFYLVKLLELDISNGGMHIGSQRKRPLCIITRGLCEETIKVLELMEIEGMEVNLVMLNVLINSFAIAGRYMEALSVYYQIKESDICPDVVTYTVLMKAFMWAKKFDQVPIIYSEMEASGCCPDRKAREMLESALVFLERRRR